MRNHRVPVLVRDLSSCQDVFFEGRPSLALNAPLVIETAALSVGMSTVAVWIDARGFAPAWWIAALVDLALLLRLSYGIAETACRWILIDTARIRVSSGVLVRQVVSLELFRIQNVWCVTRWWERPFGLGDLIIETSDPRHPVWRLAGLPDAEDLRDMLNEAAVALRSVRGVREINVGQV